MSIFNFWHQLWLNTVLLVSPADSSATRSLSVANVVDEMLVALKVKVISGVTTFCRLLYDGNRFKILVTESFYCCLHNSRNRYLSSVSSTSRTNRTNRSSACSVQRVEMKTPAVRWTRGESKFLTSVRK